MRQSVYSILHPAMLDALLGATSPIVFSGDVLLDFPNGSELHIEVVCKTANPSDLNNAQYKYWVSVVFARLLLFSLSLCWFADVSFVSELIY